MKREMVCMVLKKIFKCIILSLSCCVVKDILESLQTLNIFNRNFLEYMTLNSFLLVWFLVICILCFTVKFMKEISSMHIFIIKHQSLIMIILFVVEVITLYKCNLIWQTFSCLLEFFLLYLLLGFECNKQHDYKLKESDNPNSNYIEKPIVGRKYLTMCQEKALDELINLVDARKSEDSINVALIGEWGSGKTSITDTFIYELNTRKGKDKYFILKISVLTLKETKNIAAYVKKYFENLFKKYEIDIMGRNVAFLTSLAKILGDSVSFGDVLNVAEDNYFLDLENEKMLFIKQIHKLLKVSGRKNIIFFIDDTDRSEDEEQIIKLLVEFSSINGIISIMSLDKSRDLVRQQDVNENDDRPIYNSIDKYIHVRVRIESDNHIEYDKNINKQIIKGYNNIKHKENCFISCPAKNAKNSLFGVIKDFPTTEIINTHTFSDGRYNILTELFFDNLIGQKKSFGKYFEELIREFIYNSKELNPYIQQMLTVSPEKWHPNLYMINVQWTDSFETDEFDWLRKLQSNSGMLFWTLCGEINAVDLVSKCDVDIQNEIHNLEDLYDYWMITKYPIDNRTWEGRKDNYVQYPGIDQIKLIVLSEELKEINDSLEANEFETTKNLLSKKVKNVANLFLTSLIMADFMEYFRMILNNYRTFKMYLREAEMKNVNYLDYLIKQWQPRKKCEIITRT